MIQVTNTIVLDEREVMERFVRSTGSGGQNLPSAVERDRRLVSKERRSTVKRARNARNAD